MKQYTSSEKIQKAKLKLMSDFVFYGHIFFKLNVHEDPDCPTAWTDGVSLGYNPDFLGALSLDEIVGVFVHEIMHVINRHPLRMALDIRYREQHIRWNQAADYSINPEIVNTGGMALPAGCLVDMDRWPDELAEIIFEQLPEQKNDDGSDSTMGSGPLDSDVRPYPSQDKAELDAAENEVKQWVNSGAIKAQGVGQMTSYLRDKINKLTKVSIDWLTELSDLCEQITADDYSWSKPNRRYIQQGLYLPIMEGRSLQDLMVFVDTSGSLSTSQLEQIMTEIQGIVMVFKLRVVVVYYDTQYRGCEIFDVDDVLSPNWALHIKGRGGTNFEAAWDVLDRIDDIEPAGIVFFTDCETSSWPAADPCIPVIWAHMPSLSNSYCTSYLEYMPKHYGRTIKVPVFNKK